MKPRPDSTIARLTEVQRDDLYDWLSNHSYSEVITMAAQPPPIGFGIKFHKTTLVRFYRDERARRHAEEIAASLASDQPQIDPNELLAISKLQLLHSCYDTAHEALNDNARNQLSRALNRLESAQLKREHLSLKKHLVSIEQQRLDLDIRKFEYHAVEAAAEHAVKLNEISANPEISDRQKYALARDVVFGPPLPNSNASTANKS